MHRRTARHFELAHRAIYALNSPLLTDQQTGQQAGNLELPERLPIAPTNDAWLPCVLADFDAFLADHASCEKKASGMAVNVASHYPDQPRLLEAMADLAVEEMSHYREVIRLLISRGAQPAADTKDPYVNALQKHIRNGTDAYLMDRLLVAAVVEARGHERFGLVAQAVTDPALKKFYNAITASEHRHWQLFVQLAGHYFPHAEVHARLNELCSAEAEIVARLGRTYCPARFRSSHRCRETQSGQNQCLPRRPFSLGAGGACIRRSRGLHRQARPKPDI